MGWVFDGAASTVPCELCGVPALCTVAWPAPLQHWATFGRPASPPLATAVAHVWDESPLVRCARWGVGGVPGCCAQAGAQRSAPVPTGMPTLRAHRSGYKPERVPKLMKDNLALRAAQYPTSDSTKFCLKGQLMPSPPPSPPAPVRISNGCEMGWIGQSRWQPHERRVQQWTNS